MGYTNEERVQVKIEFLRMLVRLQVDSAKQRLLYGFFETYLKLNKEQEEIFLVEAKQVENAEEILNIPISYEEKGKEIGKEIGKKEVAVELLKKGLDIDLIRETTKLDLDEIERLKKQLQRAQIIPARRFLFTTFSVLFCSIVARSF